MPKIEALLPLKPNWFHILLSLSAQDQHGYGIMQDVLSRTHGKLKLWPATLYGTLKKLIEEGLIEETGERPAAEFDDARRRYYHLSGFGREVLDAESRRLQDLVRMIEDRRSPLQDPNAASNEVLS